MQDINFISGSGGKRPKGKKKSRDIQYTSGEVLDATQEMKRVEKKKETEKPKKKKKTKKASQPKAKKKSFFEWRTERELSAQEQAEREEKKQREEAEKKEKAQIKENKKRMAQERKRFQEDMEAAKKRSKKRTKKTAKKEETERVAISAPVPTPQPRTTSIHTAPQQTADNTPNLLNATQEVPVSEVEQQRETLQVHVSKETLQQAPASNLLQGEVYSMPAPAGPVNEKTDKKTASKKGSARIHVPPAIAADKPKRKWFTLTRQELDTTALDVNLIPDEILEQLRSRNYLRELGYVAIAGAMVVLIGYATLNVYQRKLATDSAGIEEQIQEFDREIAGFISLQTEVTSLSRRLQSLNTLLDSHVYWSPFMETLEQLTLSTVYYENMSGSAATGQFTFNVVAQSYSDIDAQVRVLRQAPEVLNVSVTSASATQETIVEGTESETVEQTQTQQSDSTTVSFIMAVDFDTSVFAYPASNAITDIDL